MTASLPASPSVLLAAGTATGAGTSVALVEACRTLSAQVHSGSIARAEVHLPPQANDAAKAASGLSLVRPGRLSAIAGEVISRSQTDIYIGFADRLPITPKGNQFRVMVVQNPHLYESTEAPSLGKAARIARTRWARWSATKADLVVCSTEASRGALMSAIPSLRPERIIVRPIRPETPQPRGEVAAVIETVILLGDLYSYKRFDVALDGVTAWATERGNPEEIRVVHCGSPRDDLAVSHFQAAVTRERSEGLTVDERGPVNHDEAMNALLEADVLVSASEVETQGLTILEALAVGVPVLARGIGPVIDVAGTAFEAFPVTGEAQDIAEGLTRMTGLERRRELVQAGLERAQMSAGWNLLPDW